MFSLLKQKHLLVLLVVINSVSSSINYIDFRQDYLNSGYAQTYFITFSLSNPVHTTHYMKINFPISLHSSSSSSSSYSASWTQDVTYQNQFPNTYHPTTMTRSTLVANAVSNVYFIKFLDNSNQPTTLNAYTAYMLRVVSSSPYVAGSTGPIDIVKLYITSSNEENHIILASNPTFSPLYFTTHSISTPTVTITNGAITAAQNQTVDVSFTPTQAISLNPKVVIVLGSNKFKILSTSCKQSLPSPYNYCYLEGSQKIVYNSTTGALSTGAAKVFKIDIQSPWDGSQVSPLTLYSVQDYYSDIIEATTNLTAISSQAIVWPAENYAATFGWGFSTALDNSIAPCFRIYGSTVDQTVYNAFTFKLTIGPGLPTSTYKFRLNLPGAQVLENSIKEDFPSSTTSGKVVCRVRTAEIICATLDTPVNGTTYTISARVSITAALSDNFGEIELFAFDNTINTFAVNSIIDKQRAIFTANYSTNLNRQVSGKPPILSLRPLESAPEIGVRLGQVSFLKFYVNSQQSDFNSFPDTDIDGGLEIFTNPNVITAQFPSSCSSGHPEVGSSHTKVCNSTSQTFGTVSTLRFRVGFYSVGDTSNKWNQMAFGSSNTFSFYYSDTKPVATSASYFADDKILDLYFSACQSGLTDEGTHVNSPNAFTTYLMNGYTVSNSTLTDNTVSVYVSNFWTGSGTNNLTGNEFPAFLQIKGKFNTGEYDAATKKLVLFFTNLDPFPASDYSTSNEVACSGTQTVKCYYYPGASSLVNNYYFYNRIDIITSLNTDALQIVIPVATRASQVQVAAVLGLAQDYTAPLSSRINLGTLQNSKPFSFTFTSPLVDVYSVDNSNLNNENYYLQTTGKKAGETSKATIYASHYDIGAGFSPNSGASNSALFTWTTKYNFFSQVTSTTPTATFISTDKCLFFSYYYPADTRYSQRYGITCPVNSNLNMPQTPEPSISIPQFLFPSAEGINMPETFSTLCDNTGFLIQYQRDIRTGVLSPNILQTVVFDPVIYQSEKGSIATISFTSTNILPRNSYLKLTTSTKPLQFSVKEGAYCALYQDAVPDLQTTFLPNNCYQYSDNYALTFKINNPNDWTSKKYFLKIYEINVTNFIEISYQDYNFSTHTDKLFLIDTTVTGSSTVSPVKFLTQTRKSDISIISASFLTDASYTKTQVVVTVITSVVKPLTRFDEIRIQFWTAPEAIDETFDFDVADFGLQTTNILKTCRIDLPYIGCRPYFDMLKPQMFTIRLKSFRNPSITSDLKYYMWDLEGNFVLNSTNSFNFPTTLNLPPTFAKLHLEKRFNYITMYPEFIFIIKLSFTLTLKSALIIRFPSAYSTLDVQDPLLCIIDALEVNCFLSNPQEITITDLPLDQPANQLFRLYILGVRQPSMAQPYNISIQVTKKNEYSTTLAYQEVPDILPAQTSTLKVLRATGVYLANQYSIASPDLTIDFMVDPGVSGSLGTSRSLIFDFPNSYGLAYHNTTLDFTLMQGATTLHHTSVVMRYFRVEVSIPTALSSNTAYKVIVKGIPNPFFEFFSLPLTLISLTDANKFNLEYQGQRYHINFEFPAAYVYDPTLNNLQFYQINGTKTSSMSYNSPFQVYAGLPSLEFKVKVSAPVRFDRMIVMDPTNLNGINFTSTPSVLNISSGLTEYKFLLTFPLDTAPGFYALKFKKVETDPSTDAATSYYSAIPPLLIQLISQQNVIDLPNFYQNTLSLPQNGYSFPITFDLTRIKPPTSLTIVAYIPPTSDINIQFEGYTEITLTSSAPVGSFTLVHAGGGAPGISQTTISFYLDGPDKGLYTIIEGPINVKLISLTDNAPSLNVNFLASSLNTTGFAINITSDQVSQIFYQIIGYYGTPNNYWEISPKVSEEVDFAFVKEMVRIRQSYVNDDFERKDEFYGVWDYETVNNLEKYSFDGLRSNVQYTLRVWAVNLKGKMSTMNQTSFTTADNQGNKTKIYVSLDSVLENRQVNKIACWLAVRYRLPFENVKDFLGFSCNDHRSRTSTPIDTILSSQYRITQYKGPAAYYYTFYLYPMSFLAYDDTKINIMTDVANSSIKTGMTNFMTSWPLITNWPSTVPNLIDVQTRVITTSSIDFVDQANNPTTTFDITSTNHSIAISGLRLNQNGFVWVYALRKSYQTSTYQDLFIPDKSQFKYYINRRLSDQNYVAMRYYQVTSVSPIDILFDGLEPNEDYILHWFAQNDDTGNQNLTSYLKSAYVKTKSAQLMLLSFLILVLPLLMAVIL